jgi:hypothetical protein
MIAVPVCASYVQIGQFECWTLQQVRSPPLVVHKCIRLPVAFWSRQATAPHLVVTSNQRCGDLLWLTHRAALCQATIADRARMATGAGSPGGITNEGDDLCSPGKWAAFPSDSSSP